MTIDEIYAKQLIEIVDKDSYVLVAGPELNGHRFQVGRQSLNGRSCPWNTFAG
jgi:hypothetical protein